MSHVQHYIWEGKIWAFGPYVLEIDIWADLFPAVVISSPCKYSQPTGDCLPFASQNVSVSPVVTYGEGKSFIAKFKRFISIPLLIWQLIKTMNNAWAIHVRLPGNLGAIGAILAPLFSKRLVAKYAGTWPNFDGEPFSYRFQKSILKSKWFNGPVTVYGDWPDQPGHIIPFFTSILTEDQIEMARVASQNRQIHTPARILFVGRLDRGKGAHVLLDSLQLLREKAIDFEARIIGDGNERNNLHNQSHRLGLDSFVKFTGAIPFKQVLEHYIWADFLILTSENAEGWPKAISEGMAFGLVCFGSKRGFIPQMLDGGRGIVIDPITPNNISEKLTKIISSPEEFSEFSTQATEWSKTYSLAGLQKAICELLNEKWQLNLALHKMEEGNPK